MRIGYARVSKADGSHSLGLERDALQAAGIDNTANLYHDFVSKVRRLRHRLDGFLSKPRDWDLFKAPREDSDPHTT